MFFKCDKKTDYILTCWSSIVIVPLVWMYGLGCRLIPRSCDDKGQVVCSDQSRERETPLHHDDTSRGVVMGGPIKGPNAGQGPRNIQGCIYFKI